MSEMIYGYVPSVLDGTEKTLSEEEFGTLPMPSSYSYRHFMSPIINQGALFTCVPNSISAAYDYYYAMNHPESTKDGKFIHMPFSINQVYNCKTTKGDGMTFKDALNFCKNSGVVSEECYKKKDFSNPQKISGYAKIPSLSIMKKSLIINGPCLIATYVRDPNRRDFWKGHGNYGGHATSIVGYDDMKESLLLRNSWGTDFAEGGYTWFPYAHFSDILEAWAIIF